MHTMFTVLSPDGVPITPKRYRSRELALLALATWCQRFWPQGYYASVNGRIALADLPARCTIVEDAWRP